MASQQSARSSRTFRCLNKSARDDGTFSRGDFSYNQEADFYVCPAGKVLTSTGTLVNDGATMLYRASNLTATPASLSRVVVRRCPPARSRVQFTRTPETLRDVTAPETYVTSRRERKRIEMLFAISSASYVSIGSGWEVHSVLKTSSCWLPPPKNLRKLAKLVPLPAPMPA